MKILFIKTPQKFTKKYNMEIEKTESRKSSCCIKFMNDISQSNYI